MMTRQVNARESLSREETSHANRQLSNHRGSLSMTAEAFKIMNRP